MSRCSLMIAALLVSCGWPEHRFREPGDAAVDAVVEDTASLAAPTMCPPESERAAPCDELRHFPDRWDVDGEGSEFCRQEAGKPATPMRRFTAKEAARVTPAGATPPEQFVVRAGLSAFGVHVFVQVLGDPRVLIDRDDPIRGDAVEIFLRGSHDRTLTGALDLDEGHHLVLTPPTAAAEGVGARYLNGKRVGAVADEQWHSRRVRSGWEVELHYPWTVLKNQPSPGMTMGFDIAFDVRDDPGGEAVHVVMHLEPVATCMDPACDDRTWCLAKAYVP